MERVNAACNWISGEAWEHKTFGQYHLHHLVYYPTREQFALPSKLTVRAIAKVADAYKLDKKTCRTFRKDGAIDYENGCLRWWIDRGEVSLLTLAGRECIPFVCGPRQAELLIHRQGQSSLATADGKFYLIACCNVDTPDPQDVSDFLGVDLGIVNIATDSDGTVYSGAQVNALRRRHRRLRQKLQAKGTTSARRLLKERRRKESRFAADVNHCISKEIVATAKDTGRGIAVEDLKHIRDRVTVRKPQRSTLSSWAFAQLRSFITYKAALAGVPVVAVDPRNTSRTCPACGLVDKRNRKSQASFKCVGCGFSAPADLNAARCIAGRAATDQPYAAGACA
jgi:IS605 OrfB family transposase